MAEIERIIMIVLDSVGIGDAPDADAFGDAGSNTLGNTAGAMGGIHLPHMGQLGIGNLTTIKGVPPCSETDGAYGRLTEASAGKDTTIGHWELMGIISPTPLPTYPHGFPTEVMEAFEAQTGRQTLGNKPASGTVIIEELGPEHMATGALIVYTSADSVFQIAAHEAVVPIEALYEACRIARRILVGEHNVGRVIARPFVGEPGSFTRTDRRRDFSAPPPAPTVLDRIVSAGQQVWAVGKIEDIFAGHGISHAVHTHDNMDGVDQALAYMATAGRGMIMANLVDFDMRYGHRNNAAAYGAALEAFDERLPELLEAMRPSDILVITADHGCDPTTPSTDHSRERVPLLVCGQPIKPSTNLGTRPTFADLGASIAQWLDVAPPQDGDSFARLVTLDSYMAD